MAWGKGGSLKSCNALLQRVENNDPILMELVILPMKTFDVDDIERLSSAIASGTNTNLTSISASGHPIPPQSLKLFGRALSTQANTILILQQDEQKSKNNSSSSSSEYSGITSLAIGSKDMGNEGIVALCEGLLQQQQQQDDDTSNGGLLEVIDFGWKNMGKEGISAIGKTFASSKHIKHIDLSRNNNIGNDGMACFANAIATALSSDENYNNAAAADVALPSLETLILSDCNIGPMGIQSLADVLLGEGGSSDNQRRRAQPINLTISCNPIGAEGCHTLSKLCSAGVISHLYMSQSSIGDEGMKLLSSNDTTAADTNMSSSCNKVAVLDLSENSVTKDGIKALAESLIGSWPNMVEVKLAKNELENVGVESLMECLVKRNEINNSTLTCITNLDLSCTNCGIEGARATLMNGTHLTTLRLFNNRLGSNGFHSIAPLLRGGHSSIANLDLGGNNAEEDAVVALLNAIADKEGCTFTSKLAVLEIGGNKFGDAAMEALTQLNLSWPKLDVAHDKPVREGEGEGEE